MRQTCQMKGVFSCGRRGERDGVVRERAKTEVRTTAKPGASFKGRMENLRLSFNHHYTPLHGPRSLNVVLHDHKEMQALRCLCRLTKCPRQDMQERGDDLEVRVPQRACSSCTAITGIKIEVARFLAYSTLQMDGILANRSYSAHVVLVAGI